MSLRFKRHHKLVVLLVVVAALLVLGLGDKPIVAYTVETNAQVTELSTTTQAGLALSDSPFVDTMSSVVISAAP
jgi:hypothetical protein